MRWMILVDNLKNNRKNLKGDHNHYLSSIQNNLCQNINARKLQPKKGH